MYSVDRTDHCRVYEKENLSMHRSQVRDEQDEVDSMMLFVSLENDCKKKGEVNED